MIKAFIKLVLFVAFLAILVVYTAFKSPSDYAILEEKIKNAIFIGDYKTAADLKGQLAIYGKKITDVCYAERSYRDDADILLGADNIGFNLNGALEIYKKSQNKHYIVKKEGNKIPYITHHIWITDEKNPRELHKKHVRRMSDTLAILDRQNPNYVHYLWVNKKELIPKSIASLKRFNVVVKEIDELSRFRELEKEIIYLKRFNFGSCSDLLRMMVLEEYGGIYMDVDVWLKTEFADLHKVHKYFDLLITYGLMNDLGFLNGFLFASPHHPLIVDTIDSTKKLIKNSPFAKYGCSKDDRVWYIGEAVLYSAFYKNYIKERNLKSVDAFIPFTLLFEDTMIVADKHESFYIRVNEDKIHFDYIGVYGTTSSWRSHDDLTWNTLDAMKFYCQVLLVDRIKKAKLFFEKGILWERLKQKLNGFS